MKKTDFDEFANTYETLLTEQTKFFGEDNGYFAEYKVRLTRTLLPKIPLRVLDFGCGIGRSIPHLHSTFPDSTIYGFDVSQESLSVAKQRYDYAEFFNEKTIPDDFEFDLIFAAGVFHHIAPEEREAAISFCYSRLSDNGNLVVFEHNPYNPITRRMVRACPFDEDAVLLPPAELRDLTKQIGFCKVEHGFTLFFPRLLSRLRSLERFLKTVPLGGQYYIWATR